MLKTTISRLKKVCSIAFVPRLLRGDQRFPPGKLELFSYAVLKKAQKSTKSTDDGEHDEKKVTYTDDLEYMFVPNKEPKLPSEKKVIEGEKKPEDEILKENATPILSSSSPLKEIQREQCQKLIDQAFGKEEPEPIIGEQYFSNGAADIDETRRAITKSELAKLQFLNDKNLDKPIADGRVQFGVFKSRDFNEEDQPVETDELILSDPLLRATAITKSEPIAFKAAPEKDPEPEVDLSFIQKSMRVQVPIEETNSELLEKVKNVQAIEAYKLQTRNTKNAEYLNLFKSAKFSNTYQNNLTRDKDANDSLPIKVLAAKDVESFIKKQVSDEINFDDAIISNIEVPDKANTAKSSSFANIMKANIEKVSQDNVDKTDIGNAIVGNSYSHFEKPEKSKDNYGMNKEDRLMSHMNLSSRHLEDFNILNATTAKENEEQLAQKIENIEETPIVEAQKPKMEGFNVTPRVLGNLDTTYNCFCEKKIETPHTGAPPGLDVTGRYDEVAKRCLDTPTSQIDEILLKEMEKLGIPITSSNRGISARSPVIDDDLVQMDVLKKPRRPVEKKDLDLESHEYEKGAVDLCVSPDKMYPIRYICKESILPDGEDIARLTMSNEADYDNDAARSQIHPNQVLIDPYDKRTLAYDTREHDPNEWYDPNRRYSYLYLPIYKHAYVSGTKEVKVCPSPKDKESDLEKDLRSMASKPPTMSVEHNTWFNQKTRSSSDSELPQQTESDTRQAHHIDYTSVHNCEMPTCETYPHPPEGYKRYATDQAPSYNYSNMNNQNSPWANQHPYPHGAETQGHNKETNSYNYANMYTSDCAWHNGQVYDDAPDEAQNNAQNNVQNNSQRGLAGTGEAPIQGYSHLNAAGMAFDKKSPESQVESPGITLLRVDNTATYDEGKVEAKPVIKPVESELKRLEKLYTKPALLDTKKFNVPDIDMRDVPVDPAPVAHQQDQSAYTKTFAKMAVLESLKPEAKTSQTVFTKGFNTNTNVSDDIWDTDTDHLDPDSTIKLAQTTYAKVIIDEPMSQPIRSLTDARADKNEASKKAAAAEIWDGELDPKHVLTCNETCPIALRPPINTCEASRLEAIFEGDFQKADVMNYSPEPEPLTELESPVSASRSAPQRQIQRATNYVIAKPKLDPIVKERVANKPAPTPTPARVPNPDTRKEALNQASLDHTANMTASPELHSLPKLNEDVSLSELLRRVRERSRILECKQAVEIQPAEGKCGKRAPRCPPTAPRSPPSNPVPPPSFGLPALKPRPRSCPPKKKTPSNKCSVCDMDLTSGVRIGLQSQSAFASPELVCEITDSAANDGEMNGKKPIADLTEDVIDRLHDLGKVLGGVLVKNRRGSKILIARDYEPWSPIPSWPTVKKPKPGSKKPSRCEPGCPVYPPPRVTHDPPCDQQPCVSFPKKTFSLLDCFAVSLGDHKVYDLGEF